MVPSYRLSRLADRDLTDIYIYSYRHFGEARADAYLISLSECLDLLATHPGMGADVGHLRAGYRRHTHSRHDIYYLIEEHGIFVVRVLGPGMSSEEHLL